MSDAGAVQIDSPLVRVPFESLRRTTRDRKYVVDEVASVTEAVRGLAEAARGPQAGAAGPSPAELLSRALQQLQGIKRKLDEIADAERADVRRCQARLAHLQELGPPPRGGEGVVEWARRRADRLLADHLLRVGWARSGEALARSAGVEALVDLGILGEAQAVVGALAARDCAPALAWCREHAARLKRGGSRLEFELLAQQYVELVRRGEVEAAVAHARRHLAPCGPAFLPSLQRAAALLAFPPDTTCQPYAAMYDEQRWSELAALYRQELCRLNSLPEVSPLAVHLQAGLAALKPPPGTSRGSREDPLRLPAFASLAEGLPCSKHVHSKLVCAISRGIMDEHNPPMVLPNNYCYSRAALEEMAAASGGTVTCPRTGLTCRLDECKRAYIS